MAGFPAGKFPPAKAAAKAPAGKPAAKSGGSSMMKTVQGIEARLGPVGPGHHNAHRTAHLIDWLKAHEHGKKVPAGKPVPSKQAPSKPVPKKLAPKKQLSPHKLAQQNKK